MKVIAIYYFPIKIYPGNNKNLNFIHINVMKMNKMHVIHMLIKIFESGILVCGILIVWEDTYGFARQYRHVLVIYLMTVL